MDMRVAVFDADGVLITQTEKFSTKYAEKYGIKSESMLPFFKGPFRKCLTGEADMKEELKPFLKEWKWERSVEEFMDYWFKSEHNINQDLIGEIKNLRGIGIKCYMASNQEKYRAEYVLKEMGFGDILDGSFISCNLGVTKFSQEFFEKMYESISPDGKIRKDQVVFWDDKESIIDVARKFGLMAFLYKDFEGFRKDLATILSASG